MRLKLFAHRGHWNLFPVDEAAWAAFPLVGSFGLRLVIPMEVLPSLWELVGGGFTSIALSAVPESIAGTRQFVCGLK
jgi:hypothetical protein